ncbi:insulinoma-associated protein 1a-like [Arapaima gigas]
MPRGFLVKRNKKSGPASYRVREEDSPVEMSVLPASAYPSSDAVNIKDPPPTQPLACNRQFENIQRVIQEISEDFDTSPLSLTPAVNPKHSQKYLLENCFDPTLKSSSPFQTEYFPATDDGNLSTSKSPAVVSRSPAKMTIKLGSHSQPSSTEVRQPTSSNAGAKQTKQKGQKLSSVVLSEKLLNYRDKGTSGPVIGLHVKEEDLLEDVKQRPNGSLLGEFICQLCKETYSDPLTLAQHRCSRIARIEYRCADCDKVFNCPANLASHRRWHRPKITAPDTVPLRGRETEPSILPVNIQNGSATHPKSQGPPGKEEIVFGCRYCGKEFQRRSYLRKHLALHRRRAATSRQNEPSAVENEARIMYEIPKQRSSSSPGPFSLKRESTHNAGLCLCRFCGDSFFSSTGLIRHINKCHLEEVNKVIFLPQRGYVRTRRKGLLICTGVRVTGSWEGQPYNKGPHANCPRAVWTEGDTMGRACVPFTGGEEVDVHRPALE